MKIIYSLVTVFSLALDTAAFCPSSPSWVAVRSSSSAVHALPMNGQDPELQSAIAEVRAAASEFSDETLYFANRWIDQMLDGKQEGIAAGLLDECVLDDSEKCQRYSRALSHLDQLLGVGMQEQF